MTRFAALNSGHAVARSTMVSALTYFVNTWSDFDKRNYTLQGPTISVCTISHGVVWFCLVTGSLPYFLVAVILFC